MTALRLHRAHAPGGGRHARAGRRVPAAGRPRATCTARRCERPRAIGIVDGYFERVPAVWHKEILWAMAQGIHVFGGASMGALRAAELAAFGMEGVGGIFDAYQRGELEDDDEVAVAHGPAEDGYRALSEAMVNIRATLAAPEAGGGVGAGRGALERVAKGLFYPERGVPPCLAAPRRGTPGEVLQRLRAWLPQGRIDQKRADALAMLSRMREHQEARMGARRRSRYLFAHTGCVGGGLSERGAAWRTRETAADATPVSEGGACSRSWGCPASSRRCTRVRSRVRWPWKRPTGRGHEVDAEEAAGRRLRPSAESRG